MKISILRYRNQLGLLALLALVSAHPAQAASEPSVVVPTPVQAPIKLAWDRVGSPIQIRV
ncbi:MAG: hypothetical protein Q8O33_11685 [Pseudomonadota bacterium]|nr:hypothetical protein [Pseudomonadota bacterium]